MKKRAFGELELAILNIVRKLNRVSVQDVHKALGSQDSYNTIMTVMSRLASKGELLREKQGRQYIYWMTPQNETKSKDVLHRIQDKIFGGKPVAMMSYLLEADQGMTENDIDEIEKWVQKQRAEKKRE